MVVDTLGSGRQRNDPYERFAQTERNTSLLAEMKKDPDYQHVNMSSIVNKFVEVGDILKDVATSTIRDDARDLETVLRFNPIVNEVVKTTGIGSKNADPYSRSILDNLGSIGNTAVNIAGLIPGVQGISAGAKLGKAASNVRKANKITQKMNAINKTADARKVNKMHKAEKASAEKVNRYWQDQAASMNLRYNIERGAKVPFEEALKGPYKMDKIKYRSKAEIAKSLEHPLKRKPAYGAVADAARIELMRGAANHVAGGYKALKKTAKSSKYAVPTVATHGARTEQEKKKKKKQY